MEKSRTTYFTQLKDCDVIIKNVPCLKCGQCGDVVFRASVVEKIVDILDNLEKITSKISIIQLLESRIIFNLFRNRISSITNIKFWIV